MTEAVETDEIDNEVEEVAEEQETEQVEKTEEESSTETAEDDGVVVSIGEESPTSEEAEQERAPQWVRDLRKERQKLARENQELKAKIAESQKPSATVLGPKPTLAACDFDEDRFEGALTQWYERKRSADAQERQKEAEEKAMQDAWKVRLEAYSEQKSKLKVSDFEDAEAVATDVLSQTQQGIILQGAKAPATVVYALGKNPKRLKDLASIADPVKFAFAVADLETQLKVTPRKAAPLPETTVRGSARVVSDQQLARLEADADRTGDRSKLIAYRKQQKQKVTT